MNAGGIAPRGGPAPEARHAATIRRRLLGGREPAEVAVQSADQHGRTPPPRGLLLRCWPKSRCCFEGPAWSGEHSVGGSEPVGSAARHYAGALIPIENGGVTGARKASAIARSATLAVSRAQSHPYRPLRLRGVGGGSVVPLDGDRLARGARAGAGRLGSGPVTRWGRVR